MTRPPRRANEPLFGRLQIAEAAVQGVILLAAVLSWYWWLNMSGVTEGQARGAAFVALVTGHISLAASILETGGRGLFRRQRCVFWLIASLAFALLALLLTVPTLLDIMQFVKPGLAELLTSVLLGLISGGLYAGARFLVRRVHQFSRIAEE